MRGKRGTGSVYLRQKKGGRPVLWICYWRNGKRFRESSGSADREIALSLLRKRMGELERGIVGRDAGRMTFSHLSALLVADYRTRGRKSLDRAQRSLAHLERHFGAFRVSEISATAIKEYVAKRLARAKPATVRLECAALKRAFNLAVKDGLLSTKPAFPTIECRNVRSGFFESDQLTAVLSELEPALQAVVLFAALTGWRKRELLGLQWRQVDLNSGTVRLEPGSTKNDEGRTFPFAAMPELANLIQRQRQYTASVERARGSIVPWVFHRGGRPIRSFDQAWRSACRRAGVPDRLFHDLRRTAVRAFERASVPRSVAMKLTGHRTESIYQRYAIVSEADLREGLRRLAEARNATPNATRALRAAGDGSLETVQPSDITGAGGGGRTHTRFEPHGILSPARLPVPPLRRKAGERS